MVYFQDAVRTGNQWTASVRGMAIRAGDAPANKQTLSKYPIKKEDAILGYIIRFSINCFWFYGS